VTETFLEPFSQHCVDLTFTVIMCLAKGGGGLEAIVASTPGGRLKRVANGRQKIYFKFKKTSNFGQNI